jgi:hypothetical protein
VEKSIAPLYIVALYSLVVEFSWGAACLVKGRNVLVFEVVGTVFIILVGSAFHFTYALSGNNPLVGSLSAVNESVWEHLKLVFWPSVFWMLIAMFLVRKEVGNFFSAKVIGSYVMVVFIPAVFYSYTAFTGESILAIDIASFVVAVVVGQFVSYRLFKQGKASQLAERIAVIAVILLAIVFIVFTFYPPHLSIFQDPITGQYGV